MTSDVSEVREGSPFDDPEFEALCREFEIWGTAQSAMCAMFWRKATTLAAQPAVLAVPVDDQNLMDEQHLRYCDRNIEASQAKGDADGVSFWHQWKAEYQRRIAAAPAIHEGGEG